VDSAGAQLPLTTLHTGASGVTWGLHELAERGHADVRLDLRNAARRAVEAWREAPDFAERHQPPVRTHASLFFGETGALLVACKLAPTRELADDLHTRVGRTRTTRRTS